MASAATAAAASRPPFRIISRRARSLLRSRNAERDGQRPHGGGSATARASPKKQEETPWPKSIRIAFYSACVVAVPLSIGQAIAMSPRLRERMLGDDVEEEEDEGSPSGGGFSSRRIISLVRNYWGVEDYVAPVDRPKLKGIEPGHRNEWEEDNQSSFLKLVGMYASKDPANGEVSSSDAAEAETIVPVSLENEPPSDVRNDQKMLSRYLSPKTNPRGVKTRLTLLPISSSEEAGYGGGEAEPGYETQCTLPGNASVGSLREHRKGSEAQAFKRDLAESDPSFLSKSTEETLRTRSWNEECRWAVSFAASDDNGAIVGEDGNDLTVDSCGGDGLPPPNASKELRHDTSIHSSWSYFPDPADGSASSPSGSNSGNAPARSAPVGPGNVDESLQVQRLQHQIMTLEKELRDPTSMRDRDGMYEELTSAKRELRSLKPWWRRFW